MSASDVTLPAAGSTGREIDLSPSSRRLGELVVRGVLGLAALISVLTTVGIVVSLLFPALEFFAEVSPWEFFTRDELGAALRARELRRRAADRRDVLGDVLGARWSRSRPGSGRRSS